MVRMGGLGWRGMTDVAFAAQPIRNPLRLAFLHVRRPRVAAPFILPMPTTALCAAVARSQLLKQTARQVQVDLRERLRQLNHIRESERMFPLRLQFDGVSIARDEGPTRAPLQRRTCVRIGPWVSCAANKWVSCAANKSANQGGRNATDDSRWQTKSHGMTRRLPSATTREQRSVPGL